MMGLRFASGSFKRKVAHYKRPIGRRITFLLPGAGRLAWDDSMI
jgi:hypothetical protein